MRNSVGLETVVLMIMGHLTEVYEIVKLLRSQDIPAKKNAGKQITFR